MSNLRVRTLYLLLQETLLLWICLSYLSNLLKSRLHGCTLLWLDGESIRSRVNGIQYLYVTVCDLRVVVNSVTSAENRRWKFEEFETIQKDNRDRMSTYLYFNLLHTRSHYDCIMEYVDYYVTPAHMCRHLNWKKDISSRTVTAWNLMRKWCDNLIPNLIYYWKRFFPQSTRAHESTSPPHLPKKVH